MTARRQILSAIPAVTDADETFSVVAVLAELDRRGSTYSPSTVRTHVTSVMCANAPDNHRTTYPDLERVDRGLYRLRTRS